MVKYFIIVGWAVLSVLALGIFGPKLVSSNSDVGVALGFAIVILVWAPLTYGVWKKLSGRANNFREEM